MTTAYMPYFTRDMVAGRGFMAIAAQNLGRGEPMLTMLSSLLFGATIAAGGVSQYFEVPSQFAAMFPYAITLIGLIILGLRKTGLKKAKHRP